jgi:hypothetical protein
MTTQPTPGSPAHTPSTERTSSTASPAPKGPASYFPSIQRTYGRPIEHWIGLVREQHAAGTVRHGELVTWLKTEHGLGHGHANAVVAHTLGLLEADA